MTVENVTYIDDLDPSYPDGTDSMSEGDDHIRNLKKSIKATFPKVSGEVPLVVKGDGVTGFESSTEFGDGPASNHNFVGDVFVGYDSPIAQPDEANGTLLCARGIIVGRGGNPGDASIQMEGNIIYELGMVDEPADDHAVNVGFLKEMFQGVEIDTNVSNGEEDGETIAWNAAAEMWQRNDLLKVQPSDKEIVLDGLAVSQPALIEQSTGADLGQMEGNHGFYLRSRRFENADDPWTGTKGNTWEIASIEPRDGSNEPARQNGIDMTCDRFTMRVNADWSSTDWWETDIVFRAEGQEVEIGARKNTSSVFTNGDVYVGHQPENRPDNNDVNDGTLFCKQGIIVGRGNTGGASIGMEGNVIWDVGDISFKGESYTILEYIEAQLQANQNNYDEILENKIQINAHENRLDKAEPKITKNQQDIASHNSRLDDLESFERAQLQANDNVLNKLIEHEMRLDSLANRPFDAISNASNFDELKAALVMALEGLKREG